MDIEKLKTTTINEVDNRCAALKELALIKNEFEEAP